MPPLVRRFLKTAIAFLLAGMTIGLWMLVRREIAGAFPLPYVVSAHTHAILVGFVMMMILGVALWMFPRPAKEDARYSVRLATCSYWLVTVGTGCRVAGELVRTGASHSFIRWGIVFAGLAQFAGIGLFFYTMWTRIRSAAQQGARVP